MTFFLWLVNFAYWNRNHFPSRICTLSCHQLSLLMAFFDSWVRREKLMGHKAALWLRPPRTFCTVDLATLCVFVSQMLAFEVGMNAWKVDTVMSFEVWKWRNMQVSSSNTFLYNLLAIQDACIMIRSLTCIWKLIIMEAYTGRTY